jgi:hypothetical protein
MLNVIRCTSFPQRREPMLNVIRSTSFPRRREPMLSVISQSSPRLQARFPSAPRLVERVRCTCVAVDHPSPV